MPSVVEVPDGSCCQQARRAVSHTAEAESLYGLRMSNVMTPNDAR